MPSFAELKAKASKATNSGVEKLQNVRDRNTSVPMKKTNWDPYGGPPPPPAPPRFNPNSKPSASLAPFPPPPSRTGSTSVGSGSASPASLSRPPSAAAAPPPPLPARGASTGPPPLPGRSNSLLPPPLPDRSASTSPASFYSAESSLPPPPTRSPASFPSSMPPPPPARAPSAIKAQPPPPPTNSATKPTASASPAFRPGVPLKHTPSSFSEPNPSLEADESHEAEIDWANLTEEDKQVFFSWLDEFFSKLLGVEVGPSTAVDSAHGSYSAGPSTTHTVTKSTNWTRA